MGIHVAYHPEKKESLELAAMIERWLKEKRHQFSYGGVDLVVAVGGDGFMMRCVGENSPKGIPSIGINTGDVGFLTSGNMENWKEALEAICGGKYLIEKRVGLELNFNGSFGPYANDVYLRHSLSVGAFRVMLNGEVLYKEFFADGVVVSTPTGSTGYNFSSGGPVVHPGVSCLLITPVGSGHVGAKPVVVSEDSVVEIEVLKSKKPGAVCLIADGQHLKDLHGEEKIAVKKHSTEMLFAVISRHDFHKALQKNKGFLK